MKFESRTILLLLFLLGLGLRLFKLDAQSFWLDEFYAVSIAQEPKFFPFGFHGQPPIYLLILEGWFKFFPVTEITARLPSAILGALAIPLFYILGKELFDKKTALWASFFLALSALHVDYSQEAKHYSLMFTAGIVIQIFYFRYVKYRQKRDLYLYGLSSVVGFYSYYYLATLFFIQLIHARLNEKELKGVFQKIAATQLIIFCFIFPRIFLILKDPDWLKAGLSWLPPLTAKIVFETTINLVSSNFWNTPYGNMIDLDTRLPVIFYCAFFVLIFFLLWRCRKNFVVKPPAFSLMLLWVFFPSLAFLAGSFIFMKIYHARYVVLTILGLYLLLAWLMTNEKSKILRAALAALFVLINATNLIFYFHNPVRAQFREAAQYVTRFARPQEKILLHGYWHEYRLFNEYFRKFGGKNTVDFCEKRQKFNPRQYSWIAAVYPSKVDTNRYPFDFKHFYGVCLYYPPERD